MIQAWKRSYLPNLMEGKGLQMKEKTGNKKMQKCNKGYPVLLVVEVFFPDNPDANIKFIKKLRTFAVNKTLIVMLFHFVD